MIKVYREIIDAQKVSLEALQGLIEILTNKLIEAELKCNPPTLIRKDKE